jgi:hypothetical protein
MHFAAATFELLGSCQRSSTEQKVFPYFRSLPSTNFNGFWLACLLMVLAQQGIRLLGNFGRLFDLKKLEHVVQFKNLIEPTVESGL